MTIDRTDFRALPVDVSGEETVDNERRFRAAIEKAFATTDDVVRSLAIALDNLTESDITDLDRVRWTGPWAPATYVENDMALDWPYLAIANKETDDPLAPLDQGDPTQLYTGGDPTLSITAKTLLVGNTYTLPFALKIPFVRVYTITGNLYSVFITDNSTGQITELLSFEASATGWQELATAGAIIGEGVSFDVGLYVQEPDPTPTIFTLSYNYVTNNNATVPAAGQIQHANKELDVLRVHKTDQNGDQSAQLATMTAGDTIEGGGIRWAIQAITDNGTWIAFTVAPQQQGAPDGVQDFVFETVTSTPITVVADPDYYLGNANIRPFYEIDGGTRVMTDDAYNVDIIVQQVSISPDWDVIAISGSGGSSSGGASAFTELTDTPNAYAGQAGKAAIVRQDETGLEFGPEAGDVFFDPAGIASYRIDRASGLLECWGFDNTSGNTATIVFPKSFALTPSVTATAQAGSNPRFAQISAATATQVQVRRYDPDGGVRDSNFYWHAIGEWDGVS